MSRTFFLCEAHRSEASQFCFCEDDPVYLCTACLPKHQEPPHDVYPLAQIELFHALGRDRVELKRRITVSQSVQAFLGRVIEREAAVQAEAKALIAAVTHKYETWLEENHRHFSRLLEGLREESALLITRPTYRVSSIAQTLFQKCGTFSEEDERRFVSIPEQESLHQLSRRCDAMCSMASRVWQTEYEEEVLRSFSSIPIPLEMRGLSAPTEELDGPIPDFCTLQSSAILTKLGPYPNEDDEPMLVKRGHILTLDGVYAGQWNAQKQRHGYGRMTWKNGDVYEGHWKHDLMSGNGRYVWASGKVYIGCYMQGKRDGFGTQYNTNGNEYSGSWFNDARHGIGSLKFGEATRWAGDYYIGEYFEDERNGRGAYFWRDGRVYVGSWKSNKHGKALMGWPSGEMYFGDWENDKRCGMGFCVYPNGEVYKGEFRGDKKAGHGRMTYPGEFYEGAWTDGKKHGEGVFNFTDGSSRRVEYANGTKVKWLS